MNDLEYIEKGSMSGLKNLKELYLSNNIKLKMIDAETWPMLYVETKVWPPIEKVIKLTKKRVKLIRNIFLVGSYSLTTIN